MLRVAGATAYLSMFELTPLPTVTMTTNQPTQPYKTPEVRAALEAFVRAVYAWGHYSREIHDRCGDALEVLGRDGAATLLRDFAGDGGLDAVASDPFVLECVERLDAAGANAEGALTDAAYLRLEGDLSLYVERTQAMIAALAQAGFGVVHDGPAPESPPAPSSSAEAAGMFAVPPDTPPQTPTTETTPTTDAGSEGAVRG